MTTTMKAEPLVMTTQATFWEKIRILEMPPTVMDAFVGLGALDTAAVVE